MSSSDPAEASFRAHFGREPAVSMSAPGRVNLIGEHTDYNQGYVLPIATPQRTRVLVAPRLDRHVRVWSADITGSEQEGRFEAGAERRTGVWVDYVAGVTVALAEAGHAVRGFDASVQSSVPLGAGLSSSAALEVAVLRALDELWRLGLGALDIALLAHRAETGFVRVPVGLMDQMASSLATATSPLFIDTQIPSYERLDLPPGTALVVINSGISHRHADGGYLVRRAECQEAAERLGVPALRAITPDMIVRLELPAPLFRRVRHVATENARVLQARTALCDADPAKFGQLMNASHASLRDDFEVSIPPVDRLVALAQAEPGVFGARMTGGGFGGCIVGLARQDRIGEAAAQIAAAFSADATVPATVLLPLTE